jgi:hypothetical protein
MTTQVNGVAKAGWSTSRVVNLAPQARRLLVAGALGSVGLNVFGWGIDSLFALMACGLVAYGVVMVAVMRRELGLRPERS